MKPATSNLEPRRAIYCLLSAVLTLPLGLAACVDAEDETKTDEQGVLSGCDVQRPYGWEKRGFNCVEVQGRRVTHLSVGEQLTIVSWPYPHLGKGSVTLRCNADGGWDELNKICKFDDGAALPQ